MRPQAHGPVEPLTRLGIEHGIATQYTSFIAIDHESFVQGGGDPTKVIQPVDMPEDVSLER